MNYFDLKGNAMKVLSQPLVNLLSCSNQSCPLLIVCIRSGRNEPSGDERVNEKVDQAMKLLVKNHSDSRYKVENLAHDLNLSCRQVERLFKGLTGVSPKYCLQQIRLNHFMELMEQGNACIKQSWIKAGFSSWGSFEYIIRKKMPGFIASINLI